MAAFATSYCLSLFLPCLRFFLCPILLVAPCTPIICLWVSSSLPSTRPSSVLLTYMSFSLIFNLSPKYYVVSICLPLSRSFCLSLFCIAVSVSLFFAVWLSLTVCQRLVINPPGDRKQPRNRDSWKGQEVIDVAERKNTNRKAGQRIDKKKRRPSVSCRPLSIDQ